MPSRIVECPDCGREGRANAKGLLCTRCHNRRLRGLGPVLGIIECRGCREEKKHCARGLCQSCYKSWSRDRSRREVLRRLGGKCVRCGCDIPEALEINHKEGGGAEEYKKRRGQSFYGAILNGSRSTEDLELTCKACNAVHYMEVIKKLPGMWKVEFIRTKVEEADENNRVNRGIQTTDGRTRIRV